MTCDEETDNRGRSRGQDEPYWLARPLSLRATDDVMREGDELRKEDDRQTDLRGRKGNYAHEQNHDRFGNGTCCSATALRLHESPMLG